MSRVDGLCRRLRVDLDLQEGWEVRPAEGPRTAVDVRGRDGQAGVVAAIAVVPGPVTDLVIRHADMPGEASAGRLDDLEEPALAAPSQVGVLRFADVDTAVAAVADLADRDVLAELAALRSPIERETPLPVLDAVDAVADLDREGLVGTAASI